MFGPHKGHAPYPSFSTTSKQTILNETNDKLFE